MRRLSTWCQAETARSHGSIFELSCHESGFATFPRWGTARPCSHQENLVAGKFACFPRLRGSASGFGHEFSHASCDGGRGLSIRAPKPPISHRICIGNRAMGYIRGASTTRRGRWTDEARSWPRRRQRGRGWGGRDPLDVYQAHAVAQRLAPGGGSAEHVPDCDPSLAAARRLVRLTALPGSLRQSLRV